MEGVIIFNIILGLFTCYLTYLIARIRQYKDPWLLILFVCFAPMYTIMIVTGMTEILFGFALVFAAYLFFKENYFASSIIISFLPFIRNEGIIIIPVYLVVYVWYKKWKAIPFLLTGILLLSCIGTLYYNDLLWILHKWPYGNTSSIYGTGNLLHYVRNASKIMGIPLIILFITGLIFSLVRFFNGFSLKPSLKLTELTLIFGPLFIYFTGYSYAWWKGMSGSGGEFRVMTPIIPFFAIYALQGINMLVSPRFINRWFKAIIYLIFLVLIIRTPFEIYQIPRHFSEPEKIIFKASQWLKQHVSGKGVIYYFDPFIQHYLDINYYDQTLIRQFLPDPVNPGEKIPEGSFIAWDAHFGATQGMVSLASLINSPSLRLVKIFKPDNYFMVLGNNYYNIFIFRKDTIVEKDYNFNQLNRLSFYNDDDIKQINIIRYLSLDTNTLTNLLDTVLAGRACTMLDTAEINSYTIKISGAEINPEFTGIRASICLLYTSPSPRD